MASMQTGWGPRRHMIGALAIGGREHNQHTGICVLCTCFLLVQKQKERGRERRVNGDSAIRINISLFQSRCCGCLPLSSHACNAHTSQRTIAAASPETPSANSPGYACAVAMAATRGPMSPTRYRTAARRSLQ
jgi:hypothetical protein